MTEIKKVNSLEELSQLSRGDVIQASENAQNLMYEKTTYNGLKMFIEFPIINNNSRVIIGRVYSKKELQNIQFIEGMIKSAGYMGAFYYPDDGEKYQEKLNLINEKTN